MKVIQDWNAVATAHCRRYGLRQGTIRFVVPNALIVLVSAQHREWTFMFPFTRSNDGWDSYQFVDRDLESMYRFMEAALKRRCSNSLASLTGLTTWRAREGF